MNRALCPHAGVVAHHSEHSQHWSPFDPQHGVQGGSPDFPDRSAVEKRIKGPAEILKLRNPEVRLEPTNNCNYNCIMCPRDRHTRPKGSMPQPFYQSVIDEVVLMGAKQITLVNFGEPFADPGLADKIDYAARQGLTTYTITNASLLHLPCRSEFARRHLESTGEQLNRGQAAILAGLTEARFSFYGTSPQIYEEIMRGGKHEQVQENMLSFLEYRAQVGREGEVGGLRSLVPQVSIYFLQLAENEGELESFVEFTRDICDYVEAWRPHNFGYGRDYREVSEAQPVKSCGRPFNGPIQVNWNGIVAPCCFDYNEEIPLGNVALQTIEEALRAPPYERLRDVHRREAFADVPYCANCDQLRQHSDALVYTTNPRHGSRTKEDIVSSPNTMPEVRLGNEG